jgi:hypothetical protein
MVFRVEPFLIGLVVTPGMLMAHPINTQTASYTLQSSDCSEPETFVLMNVASANTVTVNTGVFSAGCLINVIQIGAGQTTIVAGGGVTLNSAGGALAIGGQYQGCTILMTSGSAGVVTGSLA